MSKRGFTLLAVAVAVGGLLLTASALPHPKATRAAYDRIEVGMSQAEVEAILGGPPGDFRTGPVLWPEGENPGCVTGTDPEGAPGGTLGWSGDDGIIRVGFDRNGVSGKSLWEGSRVAVGPFALLRWRFNRWWRGLGGGPEAHPNEPVTRL
jgi:hypothetical protein